MGNNPPYDNFQPNGRGVTDNRDLVIPPGSHAFVQTLNNGEVRVHVGPKPVTFSGQEQSIRFNDQNDSFENCTKEQSLSKNIQAKQGQYIILENPAFHKDKPNELQFPSTDLKSTPELSIGKRVVIQGPVDFALWPRQKAKVVNGHHLRSNQYLEAVVYDPAAAKENWSKSLSIAPTTPVTGENARKSLSQVPEDLIVGKRLVICGTDVSFYMPPTGVEVIPNIEHTDANEDGGGDEYVRSAVTLERQEYCILVDEDGNKRYEEGPQVVFPEPTEQFIRSADKKRKFRAIELPVKSGLHIKVISDYEEDGPIGAENKPTKIQRRTGEELFLKGEDQPIYYPREEHAIVSYGDNKIHYGVAIPKGEGRYVMDRITGEIRTVTGPTILLCDPRKEVVVRRVLSDKQCQEWYPGNLEALDYNRNLRQLQEAAGGAGRRSDVLSEDSVSNAYRDRSGGFSGCSNLESYGFSSLLGARSIEPASTQVVSEEIQRRSRHTPPRSITLNTKYEGVPTIEIWAGHAVQVVDRSGNRRIVEGPKAILLEYDETLEIMELSTGKPKTTDRPLRTVYLRTQNNKVSDIVAVETRDHVVCDVKLSFSVNFEQASKDLWFSCENYVKLLCDHVRSILKGEIKKQSIEDFYLNATQLIRDTLLGEKKAATEGGNAQRAGMFFKQNGMRVSDIEVLGVDIKDAEIARLLGDAQRRTVQSNVQMLERDRDLKMVEQAEGIEQRKLLAKSKTEEAQNDIELKRIASRLALAIKRAEATLNEEQQTKEVISIRIANAKMQSEADLAATKAEQDQEMAHAKALQDLKVEMLDKETEAAVKRFGAVGENFMEGLAHLSREETLTKIATAASWQTVIGGRPLGDVVQGIFGAESPIAKALAAAVAGKSALTTAAR